MDEQAGQRIDEFLDRMSPAERNEFLSLASSNMEMQKELELQQAIDQSLHRQFGGRRLDEIVERLGKTANDAERDVGSIKRPRSLFRGLAVAALLAVSMGGLWYSWSVSRPSPVVDVYQRQPWRDFATVYDDMIRDGFQPAWICRNEKQFETAFSRRFRQPLLLTALPTGVTAGGISYSNTLSEGTMTVLGRAEGQPILVFVDKVEFDRTPPPPTPPNLHLFRREIDNLVLYELSPLDRPTVLPHFYNPASPSLP